MANPERGEVDLEIGGKTYTLALGVGALREIQKVVHTGDRRVTFKEVILGAADGDIEYLAVLVWGGLRRHHKEITLTQVDDLLDELGGMRAIQTVVEAVNELLLGTKPDARDQGEIEEARPARPLPGPTIGTTGTRSISKRAKSA